MISRSKKFFISSVARKIKGLQIGCRKTYTGTKQRVGFSKDSLRYILSVKTMDSRLLIINGELFTLMMILDKARLKSWPLMRSPILLLFSICSSHIVWLFHVILAFSFFYFFFWMCIMTISLKPNTMCGTL